ncbi:hypothetical protein BAUCODRAFT_69220, partial [Baudoinia panamericana UAMH 10762]
MATGLHPGSVDAFETISRPLVGIDRLPVRRLSDQPKEAMNCKSCRKRKIKCNRVRPSCEACQVFKCPCIYDATPRKRGPKTDVLEALLKRVNGLEKRLKDEGPSEAKNDGGVAAESAAQTLATESDTNGKGQAVDDLSGSLASDIEAQSLPSGRSAKVAAADPAKAPSDSLPVGDALVDAYFTRLHGKPFYILDEPATRQRMQKGQLPQFLLHAIYAISSIHVPRSTSDDGATGIRGLEYAHQARRAIDVDEPTIENVQALLLLAMAAFQDGKGKRSYMLLSHAISMALALSLHRELPAQLRVSWSEREGRRRLLWSCWLMDRFTVSGSKRPSLISDDCIHLRVPAWAPPGVQSRCDGNYFPSSTSFPNAVGMGNAGQGSGAVLVEIVRILGLTNRYLAAGGVKGDSHFPWHAQSTLSKIRSDLDYWAANNQDSFASLEALFRQPECSTLVLSKLVYHLIHCLVYRPFLPVDLTELSGTGQHQSWQIEATNLCFLHANAITELVEIGNGATMDWPAFVGYCVCTAGTIHVHGAHYMSHHHGNLFSNSSDYLQREMAQLSALRSLWAGVHHQGETLQNVYASHSQLVRSLAANPIRFSPVFQTEDFFDRYPGAYIDGAHVSFADI